MTVHAPAEQIAARINPAVGVLEPLDETTCILDTGADTVETLAVYLGLLGATSRSTVRRSCGLPELLAQRYAGRRRPAATCVSPSPASGASTAPWSWCSR